MVHYSERCRFKMSTGERYLGWGLGETRHMLSNVPSQWSHMGTHLLRSGTKCDNTCTVLPTREAHLSLGVQVLRWGSVMWMCSAHPCGWPERLSLQPHWGPQTSKNAFTTSHLVAHTGWWPKACGRQKHHSQQDIARVHILSQEPVKGKSWRHLRGSQFGQPGPSVLHTCIASFNLHRNSVEDSVTDRLSLFLHCGDWCPE